MSSAGLLWLETAWREGGGSGGVWCGAVPPCLLSPASSPLQTPAFRTSTFNRSHPAPLTIINISKTDGNLCQKHFPTTITNSPVFVSLLSLFLSCFLLAGLWCGGREGVGGLWSIFDISMLLRSHLLSHFIWRQQEFFTTVILRHSIGGYYIAGHRRI